MRLQCCHTLALLVGLLWAAPLTALAGQGGGQVSSNKAKQRSATRAGRASLLHSRRPSAKKTQRRPRWAPVELFHVNRRESLHLRIADSRGRAIKGNQKRLDKFFRCHHTNSQHRMDPRLMRLIYEVGRHYDGKRLEVISGYRDPGVAKNPKSPHKQGLACDFRVIGVSNQELRDYLRKTYDHVGVGYYPNSSFVHFDVRTGSSAFWIDYSAPGGNSMYSENPSDDLRSGRADTFKPTTIDPAWAKDNEASSESEEAAGSEATLSPPSSPPSGAQ